MASKSAELLLRIKTAGEESLDKLKSGFAEIGKAGAVAFTAISAIVVKSLMAYKEAEEAQNSLTRSMVNAGVYSKALSENYKKQADDLSKLTAFEDDAISAAQATLQTHLKGIAITPQLTKAVLDLAAAKKMDLSSAAELVGKTIGTETNTLARQGIEISNTTDKHKRLAEVVSKVESAMGGQAEAAAKGLGVFEQLHNSVGNLFEALGERLAPMFGVIGNWLNTLANDASKTSGAMDVFTTVIEYIAKAGVIAAATIDILGMKIGAGLATAMEAASQAASGNFKQAIETVTSGMAEIDAQTVTRTQMMWSQIAQIDAAAVQKKKESLEQEELDLVTSIENKKAIRMTAEAEEAARILEKDITDKQLALQMIGASESEQVAALIAWNDKKLANTTNALEKKRILQQKYSLIERQEELKLQEFKKKTDEQTAQNRSDTLNKIATLQSSNNHALAVAGKAAAITQIAIETPVAIAKALSAFPPPFNFAAAGLVGVAMASQAANIAGVQLAEGGIVRARPGGIQATIGEGGQDEMVVPLDRAAEFGLGGGGGGTTIHMTVYGGLLGNDAEAHEFAKAVDREMLKLRQNNESVSFDSRVI